MPSFVFDERLLSDGCKSEAAVCIEGRPGTGRTCLAREWVRRRGFEAKEFGATCYHDKAAFRRATEALRSSRSGGGILVQLGERVGTGAIFDDLDEPGVTRAARRIVLDMLHARRASLLVVVVAKSICSVPGLQRIVRDRAIPVLHTSPPTDDQLMRVAEKHGIGSPEAVKVLRTMPASARGDFRAAGAYFSAASSPTTLVEGSGTRDAPGLTLTTDDLYRLTGREGGDLHGRMRYATMAPISIQNIHAANVCKSVSREDLVTYARCLAFSGRCRSNTNFDHVGTEYSTWTGAMSSPMIGNRTRRPRKVVGSKLWSYQTKYRNKKYNH